MVNPNSISGTELAALVGGPGDMQVVDVRRAEAFEAAPRLVAGAVWRPHDEAADWGESLPAGPVVVYCVHGHQVSQSAAAVLKANGRDVRWLEGGIEAYLAAGGASVVKAALPPAAYDSGARWLTAPPLTADTLACAWLIRRFVDRSAKILVVSREWAAAVAEEVNAVPFALGEAGPSGPPPASEASVLLDRFGLEALAATGLVDRLTGREAPRSLVRVAQALIRIHGSDAFGIEACLPLFDGQFAALFTEDRAAA